MEVTRTIVLTLEPHEALYATLEEAAKGCNAVSAYAFNNRVSSRYKLHKAMYETVRAETSLTAQMTCSVMRTVAAAYKSAKSNKHKLEEPAHWNGNALDLEGGARGREFRLMPDKGIVSISTAQGRIKIPYTCGEFQQNYLQDDWFPQAAKLVRAQRKKGERLELHVSLTKDVEETEDKKGGILGVDTGRTYLAVASTGQDAHFFPAKYLKPKKEHYRRLRKRLQSKGTSSAKRTLQSIREREQRLTLDFQHVVTKQLVELAQVKGCAVIAVERLNGIRKRTGARGKKAR